MMKTHRNHRRVGKRNHYGGSILRSRGILCALEGFWPAKVIDRRPSDCELSRRLSTKKKYFQYPKRAEEEERGIKVAS